MATPENASVSDRNGNFQKFPELKCSVANHIPEYYCDLAFFCRHELLDEDRCRKIGNLSENSPYVSKAKPLLQSTSSEFDRKLILKLLRFAELSVDAEIFCELYCQLYL